MIKIKAHQTMSVTIKHQLHATITIDTFLHDHHYYPYKASAIQQVLYNKCYEQQVIDTYLVYKAYP